MDHSRVPDEERKEQAKTQSKASNGRSDYHKAYSEANKEEKQAKNRAYPERNKADLNEKAKIRMRALCQHRENALQRDATTADRPDVDE
jgi:RecA-family ATPase